MKITDIKLITLEHPEKGETIEFKLKRIPNLRRVQYTHERIRSEGTQRVSLMKVLTDEGIEGICTATSSPAQVDKLRDAMVGENPLHREKLYQMLYKGRRWLYEEPGSFGDFDNCLWDIAGKAAGLPVHALIGRVRDSFPVYLTGPDGDIEFYSSEIEAGREAGIKAYKFHSYKGGKADIELLRAMRERVGPDYVLIHDPVCSYTLREAIEVGHVMEELDFLWLEEPFLEKRLHQYQKLCRELELPVMSTENLCHDIDLSAQWLIAGGTDRLRGTAVFGTSQVLKMAHFAEMYDTNIELNGPGGLFGLVHTHLGCCIDNTDGYECLMEMKRREDHRRAGQEWGMLTAPLLEDGHLTPPDGPGWGAEWDEDRVEALTVEEY